MSGFEEKLQYQLEKCNTLLIYGFVDQTNNIEWLNGVCAELLSFANEFQEFLNTGMEKALIDGNIHVETAFLCLTQIVTCIRHLERTINAEKTRKTTLPVATRKYFLDRIQWCLQRLSMSLHVLTENPIESMKVPLEEHTFVELMDLIVECLSVFDDDESRNEKLINVTLDNSKDAIIACKQIRKIVDLILNHALAFANVALKPDKKAISALCKRLLSECLTFEEECTSKIAKEDFQQNNSYRKLKASSLENALLHLETLINEALLRLVFTCFLDNEAISVDKLRNIIRNTTADDSSVYDLIGDFDANLDRITQIGIFAIAFAPDVKTRTLVRSCLASLESLDSCIVPALQAGDAAELHAELLEHHYNEEVLVFRNAVQEMVDSQAFISCYLELLDRRICSMEKRFHKQQLHEMIKMAEFLYEHFTYDVNYKELKADNDNPHKLQLYEKFVIMLRECSAIMMCADQVESKRILKRFKILASVLSKLRDALAKKPASQVTKNKSSSIKTTAINESKSIESIGISVSIRSILYHHSKEGPMRRMRTANILKQMTKESTAIDDLPLTGKTNLINNISRKQSLRTAMFKRIQHEINKTFNKDISETTSSDTATKA